MKTANHSYTMGLEAIYNHLIYKLEDDSDWGYLREGIGIFEGRVFLVDLDDSGEEVRKLHFVEEGMQVHDVLAAGKKSGRYTQCPSGTFYYNWELDGSEEVDAAFKLLVGI